MHIEIEIKLAIAENDIEKFKQIPLLMAVAATAETQHLVTEYYDTPKQDLRHRGYVLRIRNQDGQFIQTVKTTHAADEGFHERIEWDLPIANNQPDFSTFPDDDLRQELLQGNIGKQIKPIFITDLMRTNWLVAFGQSPQLLVSLDLGYTKAAHLKKRICEVELEIVNGNKPDLAQLAVTLAEYVPLTHQEISKAARGYQIVAELAG